ncbi:hypothetical protein C0992_000554, partial [Termitomyces sp. T32_za158]
APPSHEEATQPHTAQRLKGLDARGGVMSQPASGTPPRHPATPRAHRTTLPPLSRRPPHFRPLNAQIPRDPGPDPGHLRINPN